jgi:hypothetical protein
MSNHITRYEMLASTCRNDNRLANRRKEKPLNCGTLSLYVAAGPVVISAQHLATLLTEGKMAKWEYKCVPLDRTGTKEDFGFTWTYSPWEVGTGQSGKQPLLQGLQDLGRDGWELAGVLPNDFWAEGTRTPSASHGVRTISCTLLFKRPVEEIVP